MDYEGSGEGVGIYKTLRCMACGCPLIPELNINEETGTGLCVYHASAHSPDDFPRITAQLNTKRFRRLHNALNDYDRAIAACNGNQEAIAYRDIRREMSRLHIPEAKTELRSIKGYVNGCLVDLEEPGKAYVCRMRHLIISTVIERAKSGRAEGAEDSRIVDQRWIRHILKQTFGINPDRFNQQREVAV